LIVERKVYACALKESSVIKIGNTQEREYKRRK